jgi:hypothetical protein
MRIGFYTCAAFGRAGVSGNWGRLPELWVSLLSFVWIRQWLLPIWILSAPSVRLLQWAHVLQWEPLLPPTSESSSLLPILIRCKNIDASELARTPFRASSFFVEHVIVYARLDLRNLHPGYLTVLVLEPCLREPGEIWQEIAGRVDEDHRK